MKNRLILFALFFGLISCDKNQEIQKHETVQQEIIKTPDSIVSLGMEIIEDPAREYTFAEKLVQAALERTTHDVFYDGSYLKIAYPMGDVPDSIGVCTDVVIRSYRKLGLDLQQLVHEDLRKNFKLYPNQKRWGLSKPDTNIDHRRVPNLQVFFSRHGESIPITDKASDYLPGDIVSWKINNKMVHIGIVSGQPAFLNPDRAMIIHNIGNGPELSDMLFDYEITGHYRFVGTAKHKSQ